ncbi:MAG: VWA domain-containing protein [Casimicrobiaceae bacterium]|nr:VWA domain-containing protein [Casimicrobiaceae bacterium]MCX8098773.1 VWA domain-containing protein [Casimicrobiaceae bacterium]MDW8312942.1 VWA domain-containing protein [Burkholderiales bacterium]
MRFLWPNMLWLLALLPLAVACYLWLLKRRKKQALAYAPFALLREAAQGARSWRRHLPPALLLVALTLMLIAAARPVTTLKLPANKQTIILAMDVSGSMRARDVEPNRLVAAQNAAKAFLAELPRDVRVGIVAFAGSAQVAQLPTLSREDLVAAIDAFQLQRGTATGNAIAVSLSVLFPEDGIDVSQLQWGQPSRARPLGEPSPDKPKKEREPVAPGSYTSAAIIMLTDGQRTTGIDPLEAAKMAADRGVRVYTVGIGTVAGETIAFEGWNMRVRLDEDTLKAIANRTAGEYFYAGTAADLKKVYERLSSRIAFEKRETEVSALFALAAAVLATLGAGLSLAWFGRIV